MEDNRKGLIGIVLLGVAYLAVAIFWLIQVANVGIILVNPSGVGWMNTGNFIAWVAMFIMLCILSAVAKGIFRVINVALTYVVGRPLVGLMSKKSVDREVSAVFTAAIIIAVGWAIGSVYLTGVFFAAVTEHAPHSGLLSEAGIFAHILTYVTIFGIVLPQKPRRN